MAWLNDDWLYRKKITIDADEVDANLTDFPVYLNLANLGSDFHSSVKSAGEDIRITTSDGETEVPVEVVAIDTGNETGEVWFKAPSISSSSNTDFWIYYGNAGASLPAVTDTYGRNNVWTNGYVGVWHMQEASGNRVDSTGNNNTLSDTNTVASAAGKFGLGADFERNNSEYFTLADGSQTGLDLAGDFTLSFSINFETLGIAQTLIRKYTTGGNQRAYLAEVNAGNDLVMPLSQSGSANADTLVITDLFEAGDIGNFRKIDLVVDISVSQLLAYKQGVLFDDDTGTSLASIFNSSSPFRVGATDSGMENLDGIMDELRVSTGMRTADWIAAEYSNQHTPNTFYSVGTQEDQLGGGGNFFQFI